MDTLYALFGTQTDLNPLQMAMRAIVIFVITLAMLRTSGRRSLRPHNPFDACTSVLIGAVLSRAVVGASPFWSTVAASLALVLMHRLVALACFRWRWFDDLVNGHRRDILQDGRIDERAMRKGLLTIKDLEQAAREQIKTEDLAKVARLILERDGHITVIRQGEGGS
jgi:uncharacterized membrane protein YcaP (DUF421 family)